MGLPRHTGKKEERRGFGRGMDEEDASREPKAWYEVDKKYLIKSPPELNIKFTKPPNLIRIGVTQILRNRSQILNPIPIIQT